MSKQIFSIILDKQNLSKIKLDANSTLSEARIILKSKINKKFSFIDKENFVVDDDLESEYKISDLKTEDKIFLKSTGNNEVKQEISLNIKPKNVPLPDSTLIKEEGKYKIYQYPRIDFTNKEKAIENTILIVGQTGSGKTSFINSFINYLMDIDLNDDFRYTLVIEKERLKSESQTKGIHIYNIRSKKMILRIVDTQGFGDTNGIKEDEKITLKIKDSFMNELNSINAVLFVVKSSDTRLSIHQKYIFSSIISLFGKDIQNNFLALFTFYSGTGDPDALTTLKNSDFKSVIPYIHKPWYLCFDNKIIFEDPNDEIVKIKYQKSNENYKILCDRIISLQRNSLTQTKQNLELRALLELKNKALMQLLRDQMDKMAQIEDQKKYISENEQKINKNEINFIPITSVEIYPDPLPNNERATVCNVCKFNCHYPCMDSSVYGYDVLKYTCKIWTWGFNCIFCPNKCPQSCHQLSDKIFKKKNVTNYIKVEEILDKALVEGINIAKECLKKMEDEEKKLKEKIEISQKEIKENVAELKKIAINCTSYQTKAEFLEELIEEEKRLQEEGYKRRVQLYEIMIEENKNLLKNMKI